MPDSHNGYVRWSAFVPVSLSIFGIMAVFYYFSSNQMHTQIDKMVPRTEFNLVMESLSEIKSDVKANGKQINDMNLKISKLEFTDIYKSKRK